MRGIGRVNLPWTDLPDLAVWLTVGGLKKISTIIRNTSGLGMRFRARQEIRPEPGP